jgi:hypothetical protein
VSTAPGFSHNDGTIHMMYSRCDVFPTTQVFTKIRAHMKEDIDVYPDRSGSVAETCCSKQERPVEL